MTLFNVLEPEAAAMARTNMLKLPGDLEAIIDRLSAPADGVGHIQAAVVEVTRQSDEKTDAYYQRVDATIKDYIRKELCLASNIGAHYSKFNAKRGLFGFLFLSTQATSPGLVKQVITAHSLDRHVAIQTLLDLRLKLSFISDVEKRYEIAPVEFNADLYLGMMLSYKKKDEFGAFDALRYDIYFSKQQEIAISLHRVVMECSSNQDTISRPVTESGTLIFDWAGKRFQLKRRLSATTNSNRNYMAFTPKGDEIKAPERYENSINYHQTDCLNRIIRILGALGIDSSPVVFQSTHQVKAFLEGVPALSNPLWVLDTTADPLQKGSVDSLATAFDAAKIFSADALPAPTELLEKSINYLVVSEIVPTAGSSIVEKSSMESFNTFWQALAVKQKNPAADFDFYTAAKIHRFVSSKALICQGFDLKPGKAPSQAAIEKSLQELALKEAIFKRSEVTIAGANLPCASLELIACRRDKKENVFFQVLDVAVLGESIKIEKIRRYDRFSKGEFNDDFIQLKAVLGKGSENPFDAIWNDTFLIHDKATNAWLNSYNTSRVPAIIGNTIFDNQERQDSGIPPSREVGIQTSALPYYLTPTRQKQRHSVFIQDNGIEGAWFFVAANKAANNTIPKQSLVYNIVITDEFGARVPVLSHPLGELFFSTFTFDIVKLRESAKTSILQKLVELCLHN
jgi:hypothetical protein